MRWLFVGACKEIMHLNMRRQYACPICKFYALEHEETVCVPGMQTSNAEHNVGLFLGFNA